MDVFCHVVVDMESYIIKRQSLVVWWEHFWGVDHLDKVVDLLDHHLELVGLLAHFWLQVGHAYVNQNADLSEALGQLFQLVDKRVFVFERFVVFDVQRCFEAYIGCLLVFLDVESDDFLLLLSFSSKILHFLFFESTFFFSHLQLYIF